MNQLARLLLNLRKTVLQIPRLLKLQREFWKAWQIPWQLQWVLRVLWQLQWVLQVLWQLQGL